MGVLGTGVTAGVAQTGLQAQQLGRAQSRRAQDRAYVLQRQQEVRAKRLVGLEEDDAAEAETTLHIEGDLPEHDQHHDQPPQHHPHPDTPDPAAAPAVNAEADADEPATTTYSPPAHVLHAPPATRHRLDVQA
ncbi:MAG: hypothetical protein WDZ31_06755 [Phycisphaeraceae bacterium]